MLVCSPNMHVICWSKNRDFSEFPLFNTPRPTRRRHFEFIFFDENKWAPICRRHFKFCFLRRKCWILVQNSLKCVRRGSVYNKPVLVQIIAWCWTGDMPLSESIWTPGLLAYKCVTRPRWVKSSLVTDPGPRFNIKMLSYQYRKSHCGDKTVVRSSYLHNGISYTGKMSSLYWIRALVVKSVVPVYATRVTVMFHGSN